MIIIWTLVVVAGAFVLAEAFWRFVVPPLIRHTFRGGRDEPTPLPESLAARAESVEITVEGSIMRGWLVLPPGSPNPTPPKATAVLVHGWAQEAGLMADIAASLADAGIACLLLDLRGHGRSDPMPDYNIVKQLQDIDAARDWIAGHDRLASLPSAILGFSFGGLGALLSLSRDRRWNAAVSMGAPSSPMRGTRLYMERRKLPGALLTALMVPAIRREFGFHPGELSGPRNLRKVDRPVLVVHGQKDRIVPLREAKRLAAAVPERLRSSAWIDGAGHNSILQNDRAIGVVKEFLTGNLLQHGER